MAMGTPPEHVPTCVALWLTLQSRVGGVAGEATSPERFLSRVRATCCTAKNLRSVPSSIWRVPASPSGAFCLLVDVCVFLHTDTSFGRIELTQSPMCISGSPIHVCLPPAKHFRSWLMSSEALGGGSDLEHRASPSMFSRHIVVRLWKGGGGGSGGPSRAMACVKGSHDRQPSR